MERENHYAAPDDDDRERFRKGRYRRTLVYLKKMHDDPSGHRRALGIRSVLYFILAVAFLLIVQFQSDVDLGLGAILCLVGFSMFMHMSQLCRLARNSLELNVNIIDWRRVEDLLEDSEGKLDDENVEDA